MLNRYFPPLYSNEYNWRWFLYNIFFLKIIPMSYKRHFPVNCIPFIFTLRLLHVLSNLFNVEAFKHETYFFFFGFLAEGFLFHKWEVLCGSRIFFRFVRHLLNVFTIKSVFRKTAQFKKGRKKVMLTFEITFYI